MVPRTKVISNMMNVIANMFGQNATRNLMPWLDARADAILGAFPDDQGDEVLGIAKATGIELGRLLLFNMAYELFGFCTSIVAQDAGGRIWHARNLDFGLWPAFDWKNMTWTLTEALRPLLFNANVQRGGKTLFTITSYAGLTGVHTGYRPGAFSMTINSRYDNRLDAGIVNYIKGKVNRKDHVIITAMLRSVMQNNATYAAALDAVQKAPLVGPAYVILGGTRPGEGAVVTKEDNVTLSTWTLGDARKYNDTFFVLQTNYDRWKEPLFIDDRRGPGRACMKQMGDGNISIASLFNVLSGVPTLNRLTTFSVMMSAGGGAQYEAYQQHCEVDHRLTCAFF